MAASVDSSQPWHAAYPTPTSQAAALPRQEVLQWLEGARVNGKDFVLVDVRRDDFRVSLPVWRRTIPFQCIGSEFHWYVYIQGGTIRGSLNLPAQSFYTTLSAFYALLSSSGVKDVVFYCGMLLLWDERLIYLVK